MQRRARGRWLREMLVPASVDGWPRGHALTFFIVNRSFGSNHSDETV